MFARRDLLALLERWQSGALDAHGVKEWIEQAEPPPDPALREAYAALDLMQVHLITVDDIGALRQLIEAGDIQAWERYRDAIDLDARSRSLRKNPFYRPFCR